jgi:hypothetical protein
MERICNKYLALNEEKIVEFKQKVEKRTFGFHHSLNSSPLMATSALRELCKYITKSDGKFHLEIGENDVGAGFAAAPKEITLLDAFDRLDQKTLIMLKSIHIHPDYKKLLDDFLAEFSAVMGVDFSRRYKRPICTIILASPGRVTPYHIDDSENLLLQVHGSKKFFVFDGTDRNIISARELELYWGGRNSDVARYSQEVQTKAIEYDLGPGLGVHVPLTFPHWAQNGSQMSVAVSVNFQQRKCDQLNVSWANYQLRKLGIKPHELGANNTLDSCKSAAVQSAFALRRVLKSRPSRSGVEQD